MLLLAAATVAVIATAVVADRGDNDGKVTGDQVVTEPAPTSAGAAPTTAPAPIRPSADGKALLFVSNNGVVMPVVGQAGAAAYKARTPCGGEVQLSSGRLIGEVQVVLDPGHGGLDRGASTPGGDLTEAALNLDVAKRTKAVLEGMNISVALTREADYFVPIERSVEIAATVKPKVFVSIHHNAGQAAKRTSPGMEIYHQVASPDAKRLGGLIWEEMFRTFLDKFKIQWWGASDAGVIYRLGSDKTSDFFGVLRRTAGVIPSVLIEAGFMSNPAEAELMRGNEYREAEAQAIASGIRRYLTGTDPGSGYQIPNDRSSTNNSGGTTSLCREPKIT